MCFKQIIALVLTVACLCSTCFVTTVSAETISTHSLVSSVSPLYDIADSVYSDLYIIGNKAECKSQVFGVNASKITVEQTLQKYSGWFWIWNNVDGASWSKTVSSSSAQLFNTKSGLTSGKYRVKIVCILTDRNGKTETVTVYSDEKKV